MFIYGVNVVGKYLLKISDLEENMILGEDLYNKYGNLISKRGNLLSNELIKEIKINVSDQVIYIEKAKHKYKILKDERNPEVIKSNFKRITSLIRYSFDNLRINPNSVELVKNLNLVVKDIKTNIKLNIHVLNHLTEIDEVDDYLYRHSVNVGVISHFMGQWLRLSDEDLDKLIMAGLLHDIGKLKIPDEILHKPSKLTNDEFEIVKKHSAFSYTYLENIGFNDISILSAVIHHHEKEDGKGYPMGLMGKDIPLFSKIIAIADIFDAMTSTRVYRKKELPFNVLEMLLNNNFGMLDTKLVMTFVNKFSEFYLGTRVVLNTGDVAMIIKLNEYEITKPLIKTDRGVFIDTSIHREVLMVDFYL